MFYKLSPILKYRLWGGKSLPKLLNIKSNEKIGEAWIMSCCGENNSIINSKSKKTLLDLFNEDNNIVAKGYDGSFPILIKLIDAQDNLSIQVHPKIKTEFWHILNNKPSKLYMGLKDKSNRIQISKALKSGNITHHLNYVTVKKGDSFLIKPGTIHAIGKSTFLIEIQQSADVTYRLYDFGRLEPNGKPRQLHINEGLKCIDYNQYKISKKHDKEHLIHCPFFNVFSNKVNDRLMLNVDDKSFNCITFISGSGTIKNDKRTMKFKPFDTFFLPASTGKYEINGRCHFIKTTL